ncbi:TPA: UTP--glucose-1-phosphate uridylyltransferase [Candidatus Micrarchaeota archaeon]|nr:UTP--glucose-1-phosphate uridylyltransferase [Candidatus Micrarchaeota archaeon]
MKVRKAIVLAAGFGTRFLPATKAMPKEMLPIIDKPIIHYVVEEVLSAGIKDIILVTGRGKYNIENYFDRNPELEHLLHSKGDKARLEQVEYISKMADLFYVRQKTAKGIPDAVTCCRDHVGNEPFVVLNGDDFFEGPSPVRQLMQVYEKYGSGVIGGTRIPRENVYRYGVMAGPEVEPGVIEIEKMVEKPKVEDAPSNLVSSGRWLFTPEFFDAVEETPEVRGEKWWPDVAKVVTKKTGQKFYARALDARWHAVGDQTNFVKSTIHFALQRDDMKKEIAAYIQERVKNEVGK